MSTSVNNTQIPKPLKKKVGRPLKYRNAEEAYAARLEANARWRAAHPRQWKRIQKAAQKRRKLSGYWKRPRKKAETEGVVVAGF